MTPFDDMRQYAVGIVIRDEILVWADSAAQAGQKALDLGYTEVTEVRELPDE